MTKYSVLMEDFLGLFWMGLFFICPDLRLQNSQSMLTVLAFLCMGMGFFRVFWGTVGGSYLI